jgi:predicted nucleic acid-binding protein
MDERAGARIARQQGLLVTGILGILLETAQLRLISVEEALFRVGKTNLRHTSQLFDQIRELARKRGIQL